MIVVALTDLHGRTSRLRSISDDLASADVVLIAGDLTHFGREAAAAEVLREVRNSNECVLAVPGNCDYPEVDACLTSEGVNLDGRCVVLEGVAFVGVGASLPCPGRTPNERSDSQIARTLAEAKAQLSEDTPVILLSHQPPSRTVNDTVRGGMHVGSDSVRRFIEQVQPLICFTGHIHEGRGIDSIGITRIVNPGPLGAGGYAYAEVTREVDVLEIRGVSG